MIGIIIFTVVLVLVGAILRFAGSRYYDKVYGVVEEKPVSSGSPDTMSEELVAVITAAIADDMQGGIVIRKISLLQKENDPAWTRSGKIQIMSSHTVQPKH